MRHKIQRFLDLVRYSDAELPEISLGILLAVTTLVPERLTWMPPLAQVILALGGIIRCWASLSCGLPVRNAFNVSSVALFVSMLAAELYHEGAGDELFLGAVTSVAAWCLYRTSYELTTRIDINKGK
jgi:hypothetical protein